MGSELTTRSGLRLSLESGLPWDGAAKMTVHTAAPTEYTLAFRVPGWCKAPSFTGPEGMKRTEKDGYIYFTGTWKDGDTVAIDLPMDVRLNMADPRVREDMGKVAITRGPLCYCLEQVDNGKILHLLRIDAGKVSEAKLEKTAICGQEMTAVTVPGFRQKLPENAPLYTGYAPAEESPEVLKFIPYYAWANRGEGEMSVWVRV